MRSISLVVILAGVAGCAGQGAGGPIVDMKGVDPYQYDSDLAECQMYADQVQVDQKVLGGAATGAVVGGAVGAIFDGGDGAARGAGSGAVVGGAKGVSRGVHERRRVVRNCLRHRGYAVLN